MVEACRQDPGSLGFVSAIGWYITKHAAGCYSTTPPADGFARVDPAETQRLVDAHPVRVVAGRAHRSGDDRGHRRRRRA